MPRAKAGEFKAVVDLINDVDDPETIRHEAIDALVLSSIDAVDGEIRFISVCASSAAERKRRVRAIVVEGGKATHTFDVTITVKKMRNIVANPQQRDKPKTVKQIRAERLRSKRAMEALDRLKEYQKNRGGVSERDSDV